MVLVYQRSTYVLKVKEEREREREREKERERERERENGRMHALMSVRQWEVVDGNRPDGLTISRGGLINPYNMPIVSFIKDVRFQLKTSGCSGIKIKPKIKKCAGSRTYLQIVTPGAAF